jgi:hypothetical protein
LLLEHIHFSLHDAFRYKKKKSCEKLFVWACENRHLADDEGQTYRRPAVLNRVASRSGVRQSYGVVKGIGKVRPRTGYEGPEGE